MQTWIVAFSHTTPASSSKASRSWPRSPETLSIRRGMCIKKYRSAAPKFPKFRMQNTIVAATKSTTNWQGSDGIITEGKRSFNYLNNLPDKRLQARENPRRTMMIAVASKVRRPTPIAQCRSKVDVVSLNFYSSYLHSRSHRGSTSQSG